jgi:KDO2-lipid IV(A) lauroyltransferase
MATWKQTKRILRRPFETGGFVMLMLLVPLLPRRVVVGLSRLAGHIAMMLPLREKRIGLQNIDAVFGDSKSSQEKRRILRISLATFCQTMIDLFWFNRNSAKRIPRYVHFEDSPAARAFFADRPAICITAHMGNWEIIGQTCALRGLDLASISATIKNQAVDRMLVRQRERNGQTIIPQKGALRTLIARLRKNGKVAFVLDQNTSEREGGIVVDFLGLPMPVSSAPAALAYRTGTEIMFGFCLPEPGGRYRITVTDRIMPPPFDKEADHEQAARDLTQRIQEVISDQIRRHPQYWLWSYKHWRRVPGQRYPDHYPRY